MYVSDIFKSDFFLSMNLFNDCCVVYFIDDDYYNISPARVTEQRCHTILQSKLLCGTVRILLLLFELEFTLYYSVVQ
jgi:hypothetical protein